MKKVILAVVTSLVIASPVHASPLEWAFFGTVTGPSEYHGTPIAGQDFELRIFLDTNVEGVPSRTGEVNFPGAPGEVKIVGLDPIALTFSRVAYQVTCKDANFCLPDNPLFRGFNVIGVFYDQVGVFSGTIKFDAPIASLDAAPFHLAPIAPHMPSPEANILRFVLPDGPTGLFVGATVRTFAAPEGGSVLLFLTVALVALGFLRRRRRGSAIPAGRPESRAGV